MKKYDKYKDSGIEWIGEIPEHWRSVKIKQLAIGANTLFLDGDWIESKEIVFDEDNIRYITTGNIGEGKYKEQGNGYITQETFEKLNCTEVFPGDLVISRLNPPIGRACIIPDLGKRIVTSVDNVILRSSEEYSKSFLVHFFSNPKYYEFTLLEGRGATMQRISRGILGNIKIVLPNNLSEQTAIVTYLDRKTAEIDQLIDAKKRLIELYHEEKTAIINQAVTKGINPNAKMKDSGIEWLGEVPEHWEVKRLKYFFNLITEKKESDLKKIGLENIESNKGSFIETNSDFEGQGVIFRVNDILFGKLRPYLAKVWLASFEGQAVGDFYVFRSKDNVLPAFAKYRLLDTSFIEITNSSTYGSKMPRVSWEFIADLNIAFPPIEEQQSIVHHIEAECSRIDVKIERTQRLIELLAEYRTALISEVVTGKVNVV
ncbi:MAG: restriction endonuclease subunit S [Bacteroidales bacterium]|nr:restriction endonuclease subunit S [Bacteroidales bacterium]